MLFVSGNCPSVSGIALVVAAQKWGKAGGRGEVKISMPLIYLLALGKYCGKNPPDRIQGMIPSFNLRWPGFPYRR
jgi:hypothetical protein